MNEPSRTSRKVTCPVIGLRIVTVRLGLRDDISASTSPPLTPRFSSRSRADATSPGSPAATTSSRFAAYSVGEKTSNIGSPAVTC